ncbi:Y-family DNA polymerase [Nocardioides sambongensis]|uniref:Y-family DNA polymerase n=1 Tax=Nocardioides sambongensis TaxID=2589074 RepID=UPI0022ABA04D|nr:hypothetical protein [Nocardioides sambongensis]
MGARILVVWCPDWSVTAALMDRADAGEPADRSAPAAVFSANRVVVCNAAARREGVRRGQRRRDAQARCPELLLLAAGPERDVRWFEHVLTSVEEVRPGVSPIRPGLLAVPAPGRYHGGEEAAAALLAEELVAGGVWDCRFGIADDLYAAERAARAAHSQGCVVVPPGGSAEFVAGLPIGVLADDGPEGRQLADLLHRLGLDLLGEFAGFGAAEVSNRFGSYGVDLLRRLRGGTTRLSGPRRPPRSWPARSASSRRWTPPRRSPSASGPPPSGSWPASPTASWWRPRCGSRPSSTTRRRSPAV